MKNKKRDIDAELESIDKESDSLSSVKVPRATHEESDATERTAKKSLQKPLNSVVEKQVSEQVTLTPVRESSPIPKWYKKTARQQWRLQQIKNLLCVYESGVKTKEGTLIKPSGKEVREYESSLRLLKLKQLQSINNTYDLMNEPIGLIDRLKKLDVKYASIVYMFMNNDTVEKFIINDKGRTFKRDEKQYLIKKERGKHCVSHGSRMTLYFYYQNNPFPILYDESARTPIGVVDAELMYQTQHYEYLQALANAVRMNSKLNICLFLSIINFVMLVIGIIIMLKGFEMI